MYYFIHLVHGLRCYSCLPGEPNCKTINSNSKSLVCSDNQVCYIETRFYRHNTSTSFIREPSFLQRKCQKPAQNMCQINDPIYGPCIPAKGMTMLACYSCCETDHCNTYTPLFNGSNLMRQSIIMSLFSLVVSIAMYMYY